MWRSGGVKFYHYENYYEGRSISCGREKRCESVAFIGAKSSCFPFRGYSDVLGTSYAWTGVRTGRVRFVWAAVVQAHKENRVAPRSMADTPAK